MNRFVALLASIPFLASAAEPVFPPDAKLEKLFTGFGETEGVTSAPDGMIYFSDITLSKVVRDDKGVMQGGHIWKFDPATGKTALFRSPSNKSNGLEFDMHGDLIACEGLTSAGGAFHAQT